MKKTPAYFRARISAIEELIQTIDADRDEKNNDRTIFRYGVFPDAYDEEKIVSKKMQNQNFSDSALSFEELSKFNTWFAMHPEKVAGIQHITASREFPISIKGTKEDILKTIKIRKKTKTEFAFQLYLQQKRVKAKLKILNL